MDSEKDHRLAELLRCAQRGDQSSYALFLEESARLLRTFLLKRMGHSEMAEDVLQDTLLAIHRARNTFLPCKTIGPWLYTICEHRMMDFYRKFRRLEKREVAMPDHLSQTLPATESYSNHELGEKIRTALSDLPEKQRHVIDLLKIKDLSVKEVACRTGMTESAVKVTAFRGYEKIRRILGAKRS